MKGKIIPMRFISFDRFGFIQVNSPKDIFKAIDYSSSCKILLLVTEELMYDTP